MDCVDQILHFFVIRSLQIDLSSHSPNERQEVFAALKEIFDAMVGAFSELIEIVPNSRLMVRNQRFLQKMLGIDEIDLPLHLKVCFQRPDAKSFVILTVYKLEKQLLKA